MGKGFTLVEVLVVVVIIGILTTTVMLTVRGGGEARLAVAEVRRVQGLAELAHDESLHQLVELGMQFDAGGYRFLAWDGSRWTPYDRIPAFRARRWPEPLSARLEVEGQPADLAGMAVPSAPPQVLFLSSGEVSAFRLVLVDANGNGEALSVDAAAQSQREQVERRP